MFHPTRFCEPLFMLYTLQSYLSRGMKFLRFSLTFQLANSLPHTLDEHIFQTRFDDGHSARFDAGPDEFGGD